MLIKSVFFKFFVVIQFVHAHKSECDVYEKEIHFFLSSWPLVACLNLKTKIYIEDPKMKICWGKFMKTGRTMCKDRVL